MKANVILMFVLGILICSCSGGKKAKKNDLEEMNLKGKVKSLKTFTYNAEDKFGEILKGNLLKTGDYYIFNKSGYKIEETIFDFNGGIEHKYVYKYNENMYKIGYDYYWFNGDLKEKAKYTYDDRGNIITIETMNPPQEYWHKDTCVYVYDKKGNILEKYLGNVYGYTERWKDSTYHPLNINGYTINQYTYDEQGNIISDYYESIWSSYIYKYDKNGNKIEENYRSNVVRNPKPEDKHIDRGYAKHAFAYDELGNVIEEIDPQNKKSIFKYFFDSKNNWTKQIVFNENEMPEKIVERQIDYY